MHIVAKNKIWVTTTFFISKTGHKVKVDINFLSSLFMSHFLSSSQYLSYMDSFFLK